MDSKTAQKILSDVKSTYSAIARDFSATRSELWQGFEKFLEYICDNDTLLDAGCGNGRLFQLFRAKNIEYCGCDTGAELLRIAKKNYPEGNFVEGDILRLPFQDEKFHQVFCIAALHHIPSAELREKAVSELSRVLRPEGFLFITVWDLFDFEHAFSIFFSCVKKIFGFSKLDCKDIYIPWKRETLRYYHAFSLSELKKLVEAGKLKVVRAEKWKNQWSQNLVVIAEKR